MLNLAMILEDAARKYPEREAVVTGGTRLTYAQLHERACRVAGALRALGIRPGDRVALSCPNVPYFPIAYFGILKAGAVVVPLNVLLKAPEVAFHLQDCEARAYLCFEGSAELPMAAIGREAARSVSGCEHFVVMTVDPAGPSPFEGVPTLSGLMRDQPAAFPAVATGTDDTAVILYTSGTTGRPKGAELTHANLYLNAVVARDLALRVAPAGHSPVLLVALPLFHSFGQTCQMNAGILWAGTLVLVPRFDPAAVLETMVRERVTLFSGVPTMYWALVNHARASGFDTAAVARTLLFGTSGGAAMPVELLHDVERTFGVTVLEGYGLSETSPVATFNQADLPRKVGSIGLPVIGCDVRVVDAEGSDVPTGQPGEIVIRGSNVMKGYFRKPEATAEAIRDGWFHSGDVAYRDEDGYLFIVDRVKDMIIRGGFNVYPREIEEILLTHPEVSLAAVVGVPDAANGEEIKAFVVRRPGATLDEPALVEWCRERMAAYKYPRLVEFRESLPMTATGKILKRELRQRADAPSPEPATQ